MKYYKQNSKNGGTKRETYKGEKRRVLEMKKIDGRSMISKYENDGLVFFLFIYKNI